MNWTRSHALALAKESCTHCGGMGLRREWGHRKNQKPEPCNCVLRSIFKACYSRFRHCSAKDAHISTVRLDGFSVKGRGRGFAWGHKDEEFCADFVLVSRRALTALQWRVFRAHYLEGAAWAVCCARLEMDRGNFFHEVYRIQQRLGRVFRELEPYALFPLDEYFGGAVSSSPWAGRTHPLRPQH